MIVFVISLGLLLCNTAMANTTLKVGLPAFPPFAHSASAPHKQGAVVKYYSLLQAQTGIVMDIVRMPYARMQRALKTGELDMAIFFKNINLHGHVDYIGPVSLSKVAVICKRGIQIGSYEQLLDLSSIAVIRGASFGEKFDQDIRLKKYLVNDYLQGVAMLAKGRVDAVVGSISGLEYNAQLLNKTLSKWSNKFVLQDKEWWVHFSKQSKHRAQQKQITKAVKQLFKPYLIYELYRSEHESSVNNYHTNITQPKSD